MSKADDLTNKSLNGLEKKIKSEYRKAYEGMKAQYDEYINGSDEIKNGEIIHHKSLAERFAEEEKAYKKGKYTDQEWKSWQMTQIQRGEKYNAMCDSLAKRMTETNQTASGYINDKTPSIYSLNQNYQAYEIGKGLEGVDFTLYDEQTVKNMITGSGNYTEFRTVSVDPVRDYNWNSQQIQSTLTSGILQGKSIDKIADGFMGVMKKNRNSAIRNARTAYTSAQNGGRIESLRQAQDQGIKVRKQWLSAHDGRVRDSHAILNGQIRDVDKRFDNGLLYPADSSGRPAEVYNCRCTLTYVYDGIDEDVSSEIYESEKLQGETYNQFVKRIKNGSKSGVDNGKAQSTSSIKYNLDGATQEQAEMVKSQFEKLSAEYNTTAKIHEVNIGKTMSKAGGETFYGSDGKDAIITFPKSALGKGNYKLDRLMWNSVEVDNEANSRLGTITHELAHSIAPLNAHGTNSEFWNEVKKLKNKYERELTKIDKDVIVNKTLTTAEGNELKRGIYISKYASTSLGEFMAEGFADAKLSNNPSKYSIQIMEIIDKYFKKGV